MIGRERWTRLVARLRWIYLIHMLIIDVRIHTAHADRERKMDELIEFIVCLPHAARHNLLVVPG